MKFKFAALLVALPAVVAGLLVSAPAEAASYYAYAGKSTSIVISPAGEGLLYVSCASSHTCKGKVSFDHDPRTTSYSVAGKSGKYVTIRSTLGGLADPADGTQNGDYKYKPVTVVVNEDSPKNVTHEYAGRRVETKVATQEITGTINIHGPSAPTDIRVELVSVARGGNTSSRYLGGSDLQDGDSFLANVRLGTNNSSAAPYHLLISAKDQEGKRRQWYWRGSSGHPVDGGKDLREATEIRAGKTGPFVADFHMGSISGHLSGAYGEADVTVAAPPASYSSSGVTNRDMDVPGCANIFGETHVTNEGDYTVNFLPYTPGSKRYMVRGDDHTTDQARWMGSNGDYGSCFDVLKYGASRTPITTYLLALDGPSPQEIVLDDNENSLFVDANYKATPTAKNDRFIQLRELVPNTSILDAPVIDHAFAGSDGKHTFTNIPAGRYWVEVGRRTGCSAWYASRYSNNSNYLSGEDRGVEAWKTVAGKYAERQRSYDMGYVAKTPPRGYKGWMYRGYCGATSTGRYEPITVEKDKPATIAMMLHKGATVTGKVTRGGGRTNKEMMVSLVSTGHTNVLRTDLTDGSGRFSVKGLAPGTYRIVVNADSWRGITRTFSGRHSITVKAGKSYSAGTLRFQNQSDRADVD